MKTKGVFVSVVLFLLLGCSAPLRFYPVQGTLASRNPVPVLSGKLTVHASRSGDITVVMTDGEVCKGRWQLVRPQQSSAGATASVPPETSAMSPLWDQIYGPGYYVAHVLGSNRYLHAVVTGNKGTVFQVELFAPAGEPEHTGNPDVKGVAKDNKDNLYKVVI